MLKHNDKKLIYFFCISISLLMIIFAINNAMFPLFLINLFVFFLIVFKAKYSIFSLKTLICFYVLIPIFFQQYTGKSLGSLELAISVNHMKLETININMIIYIYLIANYFFITNTDILLKEKKIISKISDLDTPYPFFFGLMAIVLIFVYYPPSFLSNGERFFHLLPGNFWNHLSIIFLIFLLPTIKKNHFYILPWIFVIGWCFLKKERVDAIGLLILLLISLLFMKIISKRICFIILIFFVIFLAIMGITRIGNGFSSFGDFIYGIVVQSTSADIAYVLNISIRYTKDYGFLSGQSYYNYLYELLPIGTSNFDASSILNTSYGHPGGIHLLSEPYMNFGYFGVVLYSILECFFLKWLFERKHNIVIIYYCYFVVASFRYCWYGLRYLETGIIYLIPLTYLLYKLLYNSKKRNMRNVVDKNLL